MVFTKSFSSLLVVAIFCAGCDLYPELVDLNTSTAELQYKGESFVKDKDREGQEFLRGTGSITHQTKINNIASRVKVRLKLKFDRANSEVTLFSHASENLILGYEIRFARVGNTLRLSTALQTENSKFLGLVLDNIENWSDPIDLVVEIDNRRGQPSMRAWSPQAGSTAESAKALKETREDGYPEGEHMGLRAVGISLYSFTFTEY